MDGGWSAPWLMGGAPQGRALEHPGGNLGWQWEPWRRSLELSAGLIQWAEGSPVSTGWIDLNGKECTPQTPEPMLLSKSVARLSKRNKEKKKISRQRSTG